MKRMMVKIGLALLINYNSFALAANHYDASCKLKIDSDIAIKEVKIQLYRDEFTIGFNDEEYECLFIDEYDESIYFYQCGDYKVNFYDNMEYLIFQGREYRCNFRSIN